MKNSNPKNHAGFSALELMIVIGIVSIMAAIIGTNVGRWTPNLRLKQASRDLLSSMQKARLEAVTNNTTVAITFTPVNCVAAPVLNVPSPGGTYRIFIDDGGGVAANANNFNEDAGETLVDSGAMPNNVALCNNLNGHITSFGAGATLQTGFTSQGLPAGGRNGRVTLANDQDRTYQIILSTAGRLTLQ